MIRILAVACLLVVIIASISVVVAASRFQLASETSSPFEPITCFPDDETRDKVKSILSEAIDQALRDHVVRMHEIWMRDDRGQPERARNGTRQGLKAFIAGHTFVKKWNPPICPPETPK